LALNSGLALFVLTVNVFSAIIASELVGHHRARTVASQPIPRNSMSCKESVSDQLMTGNNPLQPVNLRQAAGHECCGSCIMYRSLNDYKELVSRFGLGSPLVRAYGYGQVYLEKDGICEMSGDPPVLISEVCDLYLP
jgi:hypothetical protein